jgi:hypothetical protein
MTRTEIAEALAPSFPKRVEAAASPAFLAISRSTASLTQVNRGKVL